MLDTNIVSHAVRDSSGVVAKRLLSVSAGECCLSIITVAELRFGAAKVNSDRLRRQIDGFVELAPAVPFEAPADVIYAEIRAELEARGQPIGPHDLFIAAHALSLDLTLVTGNSREFSRVPGLRLENWLD
jgi:tRNA(fMet)-specific endonuclease VapC